MSETAVLRSLDAARRGDEHAFRALVAPHLPALHRHCYRMLGSVHDADDAVQETLLRAWRALDRFEGRSSFTSWLYRIATNTSLTMINRRPRRVLRLDDLPPGDPRVAPDPPLSEQIWVEPMPDDLADPAPDGSPEARTEERESLELAFVAALQHLPARQRAVLLLRDVLGFSGAEVADMLDTIPSSVYSLLQRAHRAVDERVPEASQQTTLRALGDRRIRELAGRYVAAWESADVGALAALLTEDAVMAMPPRPTWYRGRDDVAAFAAVLLRPGARWRFLPTRANGQIAFGCYVWQDERQTFAAHCLQVLRLSSDGRVEEIMSFLDAALFDRFKLPAQLPDA